MGVRVDLFDENNEAKMLQYLSMWQWSQSIPFIEIRKFIPIENVSSFALVSPIWWKMNAKSGTNLSF